MTGRQKGAIGIFKDTEVKVNGLTLLLQNPDREWELVADAMTMGDATADMRTRTSQAADFVFRWARTIRDLAATSTNKGYVDGETEEGAKVMWEAGKAAAPAGAGAAAAAAEEDLNAPRLSYFGFDEDGNGVDEEEDAKDAKAIVSMDL